MHGSIAVSRRLTAAFGLWATGLLGAGLIGACAGTTLIDVEGARRSGQPIYVAKAYLSRSAPAGDIGANVQFFNTSHKTYKYVDFTVIAYNRVGDALPARAKSDASGAAAESTTAVKLRFTGPLRPRRTPGVSSWPDLWPRAPLTCLEIRRIDLIHMDGTELVLEDTNLVGTLAANTVQRCHPT